MANKKLFCFCADLLRRTRHGDEQEQLAAHWARIVEASLRCALQYGLATFDHLPNEVAAFHFAPDIAACTLELVAIAKVEPVKHRKEQVCDCCIQQLG